MIAATVAKCKMRTILTRVHATLRFACCSCFAKAVGKTTCHLNWNTGIQPQLNLRPSLIISVLFMTRLSLLQAWHHTDHSTGEWKMPIALPSSVSVTVSEKCWVKTVVSFHDSHKKKWIFSKNKPDGSRNFTRLCLRSKFWKNLLSEYWIIVWCNNSWSVWDRRKVSTSYAPKQN